MSRITLLSCAVVCCVAWACGSSSGGDKDVLGVDTVPNLDVLPDSTSDAPGELLADAPGELLTDGTMDAEPDAAGTDAEDWMLSDDIFAYELTVTLIPSSDEDFPTTYNQVSLRLFNGAVPCSEFGVFPQDDPTAAKELTVSSLDSWKAFGGLHFAEEYTVVARVLRDEGGQARVVAWGCADQIVSTTQTWTVGSMGVEIALQMIGLESAGSYEYFEEYTLDEAVVGQALMPTLSPLESLLSTPGSLFLGFLDAHLLPSLVGVSDAAYLAFQEEMEDAVMAQLQEALPVPVLIDLQSVVKAALNPRFEGTLELAQEGAKITASGTMQRLVLTWEFNGQPKVWTQAMEVSPGQEAETFGWAGQVHSVTQLDVASSSIVMNLGGIWGEFVSLEVLPVVTGVPTLADYLESLLDCSAIVAAVSSEALAGIGLTPDGLIDVCTGTLGQIEETITTLLDTASMPVTVYRWGTCTLVEAFGDNEDNDLVVEQLEHGVWIGESLLGAGQAPVTGTFGATRVPPAN